METISRFLSYLTWCGLAVALNFAPSPVLAHGTGGHAEARQLIAIADGIAATHPSHDYTNLTSSGVSAGQIQWGPVVAFTGPLPDVPSMRVFGLNVNGVPSDDCVAFVSDAAPRFSDVWIAGDGPSDVGASVYSHGHLSSSKLARACAGSPSLGMDFISP